METYMPKQIYFVSWSKCIVDLKSRQVCDVKYSKTKVFLNSHPFKKWVILLEWPFLYHLRTLKLFQDSNTCIRRSLSGWKPCLHAAIIKNSQMAGQNFLHSSSKHGDALKLQFWLFIHAKKKNSQVIGVTERSRSERNIYGLIYKAIPAIWNL